MVTPNRWHAAYMATSMLRRAGGLAAVVLRRDGDGARHRAAWLWGCVTGAAVGFAERRRRRREPPDLSMLVPAQP